MKRTIASFGLTLLAFVIGIPLAVLINPRPAQATSPTCTTCQVIAAVNASATSIATAVSGIKVPAPVVIDFAPVTRVLNDILNAIRDNRQAHVEVSLPAHPPSYFISQTHVFDGTDLGGFWILNIDQPALQKVRLYQIQANLLNLTAGGVNSAPSHGNGVLIRHILPGPYPVPKDKGDSGLLLDRLLNVDTAPSQNFSVVPQGRFLLGDAKLYIAASPGAILRVTVEYGLEEK